jgi:hypothetical protein
MGGAAGQGHRPHEPVLDLPGGAGADGRGTVETKDVDFSPAPPKPARR